MTWGVSEETSYLFFVVKMFFSSNNRMYNNKYTLTQKFLSDDYAICFWLELASDCASRSQTWDAAVTM